VSKHKPELAEQLNTNKDIKRELAFYNIARENVKEGMSFLVQMKQPISRPDDFFAEMVKSDKQMSKVKHRLLKQQVKIQSFEERKKKAEQKKFHKAVSTIITSDQSLQTGREAQDAEAEQRAGLQVQGGTQTEQSRHG